MFEFLIVIALLVAVVLVPLFLLALALRVLFELVLLPFHLLGALLGLGIGGLILGTIGTVVALVLGALALGGALVIGMPVLVVAGLAWLLARLLRREKSPARAA